MLCLVNKCLLPIVQRKGLSSDLSLLTKGLSLSLTKVEELELVLKLFFTGLDPTLVHVHVHNYYTCDVSLKLSSSVVLVN